VGKQSFWRNIGETRRGKPYPMYYNGDFKSVGHQNQMDTPLDTDITVYETLKTTGSINLGSVPQEEPMYYKRVINL
jgi:hypothetical protein